MCLSKKKEQGISMIECLVSVIILAVGIAGVVGLQVRSLQSSNHAKSVAAAIILSEDIIERVRANVDNRSQYKLSKKIDPNACQTMPNYNAGTRVSRQDLDQWEAKVACELPDPNVEVSFDGDTITVSIDWAGSNPAERHSHSVDALL